MDFNYTFKGLHCQTFFYQLSTCYSLVRKDIRTRNTNKFSIIIDIRRGSIEVLLMLAIKFGLCIEVNKNMHNRTIMRLMKMLYASLFRW